MSMYERIQNGEFENKVPYPSDRNDKDGKIAYRVGEHAAYSLFKEALEEEFGTKGNPKADKLFEKAWAEGHPNGLYEVFGHYEDSFCYNSS